MKFSKYLIAIATIVLSTAAFSQDGEGLFKAKCNTCHILGKDGTGPNLKGVKQKWEEAGEGELLYDWVRNSDELIKSGKSKQALAIQSFSPTTMTPQDVTNEDVDAILAYVDAWEPAPEATSVAPVDGKKVVVYVPNYRKNLSLFYFLIVLMIVQILAILVMSSSIKSMLRLNKDKKKSAGSDAVKMVLVIVGMFGLMATNSVNALTFVSYAQDPEAPWLLVEDYDIYVMVGLNIMLVFFLLYIRRIFFEITYTVRPKASQAVNKQKGWRMKKALTDAVPIEEEEAILMSHEYDGIRELDNNLPPWWVWGFYTTILFAVLYLLNYHILKTGDLQTAEYEKSVTEANAEVQEYLEKMAMNVDENNVTLLTDDKDLNTGKAIFEANCITCHNPKGEGNQIGPNLTDNHWIYGYDIKDVFTSIKYGRPGGMPEHNSKLNPVQLQQVGSFILSLPEAKGREPQGDIVEPSDE